MWLENATSQNEVKLRFAGGRLYFDFSLDYDVAAFVFLTPLTELVRALAQQRSAQRAELAT